MAKNAQDVANKWAQRLGAATDSIRQGVQGVTVNPAQKAAARADAYAAGVAQAVADGRYQRGLQKVSLASWQEAMITKGIPRVAAGANAGKQKMADFMQKWLPHQAALQSKLAAMPRGDLQTNIQRMIMAVEHNASFQG